MSIPLSDVLDAYDFDVESAQVVLKDPGSNQSLILDMAAHPGFVHVTRSDGSAVGVVLTLDELQAAQPQLVEALIIEAGLQLPPASTADDIADGRLGWEFRQVVPDGERNRKGTAYTEVNRLEDDSPAPKGTGTMTLFGPLGNPDGNRAGVGPVQMGAIAALVSWLDGQVSS